MTKLVDGVRKFKATPIGPYLFHLYAGQELLNGEEMVAYEIGQDLLKYDCTPEPDPDQGQDSPTRSDPTPSRIDERRRIDPDPPRVAGTGIRRWTSPNKS